MESSEEDVLLQALNKAGVTIPNDVESLPDLTPDTFIPICAKSLNLIGCDDETSPSFSSNSRLPDSMIDKIKICTDMAFAFKRIGFIGDLSYYQFLYPSEEDLYELLRFLVEKLSKSSNLVINEILSETRKLKEDEPANDLDEHKQKPDNEGLDLSYYKEKLRDLGLNTLDTELFTSDADDTLEGKLRTLDISEDDLTELNENPFAQEQQESINDAPENDESVLHTNDIHVEESSTSQQIQCEVRQLENDEEVQQLENDKEVLSAEIALRTSEIKHLEEDYELMKTIAEMSFDDHNTIDFYVKQLSGQVNARKRSMVELESQWDTLRKPLEEKVRGLEAFLYANLPDAEEKLQNLREAEQEKQFVLAELRRREGELLQCSAELEKQPKMPSRLTYIERIREITKNSRKQDADIARIIKETRELQLESNSIQERLHRIYTVLDEIVFREAKKDPVGRQAYRLLTSIHEMFEQICEQILNTDRLRREAAEHEKKVRAVVARTLNADKLRADVDAMRKENEVLQHQMEES